MSDPTLYAVIMAGGRGSRFWPRSRKKSSKQVLNIVGNNTMIQDAIYRLEDIIPPDRIYVMTNQLLRDTILEQVPEIPELHVIAEPEPRSTAPCIGLAAAMLQKRDGNAVMAVFAADHLIKDVHKFHSDLMFAARVAHQQDMLVTFGVPPTRPDTGVGYIHAGDPVMEGPEIQARRVVRFVEKPDMERASEFLKDPDYFINSGMFVWKVSTIMEEFDKYLPELAAGVRKIEQKLGTPLEIKAIGEEFPRMPKISVDFGVMEKSDRVAMVPAGFGWNDIGSWDSLYDVWPKDEDGNAWIGRKLCINSGNSLIYSPKKLVAAIGVKDLVIVETDDALLVCDRNNAQDVSRVVEMCRELKMEEYL